MQAQIKPWGNSQGIRLPKALLEEAGIRVNDVLQVRVEGRSIMLTPGFQHRSLRERAAVCGGSLDLSDELDWGDPAGNEAW